MSGEKYQAPLEATESSFFENLREHAFIADLLQEAWVVRGKQIDILRSEVDASGYDLVLDCDGIIRHVQLKTSKANAKTKPQKVNVKLAQKPSGCVIWLLANEDPESGRLKFLYLFFGNGPGEPLPGLGDLKVGKHTKADARGRKGERPNIRVIPKSRFRSIESIGALLDVLFGPSA